MSVPGDNSTQNFTESFEALASMAFSPTTLNSKNFERKKQGKMTDP